MIEFHDYDPAHTFDVFGEKHIIQNSKVTLDYVPLKGSVGVRIKKEQSKMSTSKCVVQSTYQK